MRYVALPRGINVTGSNMIKMTELKAAFESLGFDNVVSYINSGNIAFDVPTLQKPARSKGARGVETALVSMIEAAMEKDFGKPIPAFVRKQKDILRVLKNNPFDGQYESHKEMHVLFLHDNMPDDKRDQLIAAAPEGERFEVRGREIYCHLKLGVAGSLLGKGFIERKLKTPFTARNWRTVERLVWL